MADDAKLGFSLPRLPLRTGILALIAVQSVDGLSRDLPSLATSSPDVFGTAIDAGFFAWGVGGILTQVGVLKQDAAPAPLAGLDVSLALSIGREPGTWMPSDWAASGARLSLPLVLRFTDEPVDLGFPGEEALGGRSARKLVCEGGRFVGPQGEVVVRADGGAWSSTPAGRGESVVRFFLDFPESASRNDVSLPAGRVFFSCACREEVAPDAPPDAASGAGAPPEADAPPPSELVGAPRGVQLARSGQLTIKRNDVRNAFGAFGDVFLILGRFSVSSIAASAEHAPAEEASEE